MQSLEIIVTGCQDIAPIPWVVGHLITTIYTAIRILVPVVLLLVGMVDLGKSIVAKNEDEIKKAQKLLFRKIIIGIVIFLLFMIIQFTINIVDSKNPNNASMWTCIKDLLSTK